MGSRPGRASTRGGPGAGRPLSCIRALGTQMPAFALGRIVLITGTPSWEPCSSIWAPAAFCGLGHPDTPSESVHWNSQEYWNRLPFPSPGDLPDPGIELVSPVSPALQEDSLYINKNQPWVYCCSLPPEPPSHLLLHPAPLGCWTGNFKSKV